MYRKLADVITLDFTVHLPTTGAVSNADALPTVQVWEDASDTALPDVGGVPVAIVTLRVGTTGNYRVVVTATTANGFEVGKSYNVVVTAIAGGVTAKAVVGSFFIDSKRHGDLNDLGGTAQSGDTYAQLGVAGANLTAIGDTRIANLDTPVSGVAAAAATDVWAAGTKALTDKAGFSISGTTQTLDALAALLRGVDNDTLKTLSEQIDLQALETTLTAIKGAGWTTETLKTLVDLIDTIGHEVQYPFG